MNIFGALQSIRELKRKVRILENAYTNLESELALEKEYNESFAQRIKFLEDENKANEWHYVNWKYFADKNCPKSELSSYLVQLKNKDLLICDWKTEEGFGCFWDSNLNPIDNDDVYTWKEIVLPKEK